MIRLTLYIACLVLLGANDLGSRTLFNGIATQPDTWETDGIVINNSKDDLLVLSLKGKSFGSAAPIRKCEYVEGATIQLVVDSIAGGTLSAQIEWFDEDNAFLKATELLPRDAKNKSIESKKLSDLLPSPDAKPQSFRIKFWLEGDGAKAVISKAFAAAPRAWRDTPTRLVRSYKPATAKLEADKGIRVEKESDAFTISLEKGTKFGGVTLVQRADYSPDGVVMIDLPDLKAGTATLQALCWNSSGAFIKAVDVMKDIADPGSHEAAFKLFAEQFPAETKQVSYKLWIAGDEGAVARVQGIYYGVSGAAR